MKQKQDEIKEEREAAVLLIGILLMVVPAAVLVATCIYIPTLLFWGGYVVYAIGCVIVLAHSQVVKRGMLLSWQLGLTGDKCPYCREELMEHGYKHHWTCPTKDCEFNREVDEE